VALATRRGAEVAAAIAWSDDDAHGALTVGRADGDGDWKWKVVVSPDVPEGPGQVLVSAEDRTWYADGEGEKASTTHESGTGRYHIEVKDSC
jgi:hypothetical protein